MRNLRSDDAREKESTSYSLGIPKHLHLLPDNARVFSSV